jgi:hypothetical protein
VAVAVTEQAQSSPPNNRKLVRIGALAGALAGVGRRDGRRRRPGRGRGHRDRAAPRTGWLPPEVARDAHGFILTGEQRPDATDGLGLSSTMPGVFAAGDVRLNPVKRVAAAVGDGSTAIRQIHEYRVQRLQRSPVS